MLNSFLLFPQSLKEMWPDANGQLWVLEIQKANSRVLLSVPPGSSGSDQASVCGKLVLPSRLCLQLGHR